MLKKLLHAHRRKQLRDPQFDFLFDEHVPPDEYVSFDCETTSLDSKTAEIVSIGAVKIRGREVLTSESFYVLVKPEGEMCADNISIHGLRPKDLCDGIPIDEAVKQLLHFIGNRPVVGYYLEFDIEMVNKFLKPMLGIKLPNRCIEVSSQYYAQQAKKYGHNSYIDLRLEHISGQLGLPKTPRHNALSDAVHVALMFLCLQHREA